MSAFTTHKELFSGVLHKCGGKIKSWNKRWMILKSDYCLYYYKDTAKGHLGVISLRDPRFKIRKGEVGDCSWSKNAKLENTIVIVTSPRTYFMYAETSDEAEEWKRMLTNAHQKLIDEAHRGNKLLNKQYPKSTSSIAELQTNQNGISPRSQRASMSELECTRVKGSPDHTSRSIPKSSSGGLQVPEEYQAVYSVPSDDNVSHSSSDGTKTSSGQNDDVFSGEPLVDAIYDLAKPELIEESARDSVGPTRDYELMDSPPQTRREVHQPALHTSSETSDQAVYEFVESHFVPGEEPSSVTSSVLSSSVVGQPLPPIPKPLSCSTGDAKKVLVSSQIYEDIPGGVAMYEDLDKEGRFGERRENVQEATNSGDEGDGERNSPPPPLPPKDTDAPPLPPKDDKNALPLPPKDNRTPPSLSPKHKTPALPPKDSRTPPPLSPKHETPLLPPKDAKTSPRFSPVESQPSDFQRTTPPPHKEMNDTLLPPSSGVKMSPRVPRKVRDSPPLRTKKGSPPSPRRKTDKLPPLPPREDLAIQTTQTLAQDSPVVANGADEDEDEAIYDEVPFEELLSLVNRIENEETRHGETTAEASEAKERGLALFKKRQEMASHLTEEEWKQRTHSIQLLKGVASDPSLSAEEKILFAETLRQVELERLKASEERFRWERERMKLAEDRRAMEEEKRRLCEELERTRKQLANTLY